METEAAGTERVRLAVDGDPAELEALLRDVESELRASLSVQPLWSRSLDVDDVLQVSYLEAFLRISTLERATLAGFRAWMKRIAANNLRDAVRALERDKRPDAKRRTTRGPDGESVRTLFGAIAGDEATAGGRVVVAEAIDRLRASIARLPASYRRVVEEVDLAERPVAQVAQELGKSAGTVHMLRSRAHDRLGELLCE